MTNLNKTPLTTSQKIECAAKVVAMQEHGEKTQLSQEYNLSRPTLYELEMTSEELLRQHIESGSGINIRVDKAQLERAVVALRVIAPDSLFCKMQDLTLSFFTDRDFLPFVEFLDLKPAI